jgi:hypothetical protein
MLTCESDEAPGGWRSTTGRALLMGQRPMLTRIARIVRSAELAEQMLWPQKLDVR